MSPWLLAGIFVAAFIPAAWFFYQWYTSDEEEDETSDFDGDATAQMSGSGGQKTLSDTLATTTEEYRGARKSRMIALKESLEKSLETRHGAVVDATSKDRLTMPWFLLIGGEGSGKTTMLANAGLPLPYGPAFEVDSKKRDAGRWWLYEDAVVLEAPAALPGATATGTTLTPDQTQPVNTSEGWNTLLHMLSRERPDSPLNGIIITVSAEELLAARVDPEKMIDQAERIRLFLERTRKMLGVRLPLHVIVTKCDTIAGFRSFANNLPPERRDDIFGWSNPEKVDAPFNPDWVDHAMSGMKSHLDDLRDEVLAAPDEIVDADGLFVFVPSFAELHEPLKEFVTHLFSGPEKRASQFLRGMYFCGDTVERKAEPQSKEKVRATMQISAEMVLTGKTKGHSLVFLRSLFVNKIFREAGLAKPVTRLGLSRDKRVVIAQAAAIIFLLVGGTGLWLSLNGYRSNGALNPGLRHDAEAVTAMLAGMAIDIDEVKRGAGGADSLLDRRMRDAAVIEVVSEMRNVETIRKSPFIPASWFSPLPRDIRRSMIAGIESIVLPVSRQRLQERIDQLVRDTGAVADPRELTAYLTEVKSLSRHIAMYNALASPDSGSVSQLASLLDYLYAERPLEGDSSYTSQDFQDALRVASAERIVLSPDMTRSVLSRSVRLVSTVARSSARQLAAGAERAANPEADLEALRGLNALVELSDRQRGLVASVSDSTIFGMRLARIIQDSIGAELRLAGLRMWRDSLLPADAETRLRTFIGQLFQMRLMERPTDIRVRPDISPRQRLRWDVGRLEMVTALRSEFDKALYLVATSFQHQSPERYRRAFEVQLRARAIDAAANAQRFTTIGFADSAEVKASVANLDLAAPRIFRAARVLDTLGAPGEGRALIAAATRHAEQVLVMSKALLESGSYFVPNTLLMSRWNGIIPLSHSAMGIETNDTLRLVGSLSGNLRSVFDISHYAQPAVRFLKRTGVDSVRVPRLLAEFEALTTSAERMERGEMGTSTLAQLHAYVRDGLGVRDMASCSAAARVPDTSRVSDVFQLKRRQYRMAMVGRCASGGDEAAVAYQRLRSVFATRVAGRFPFADTLRAGAPDADPAGVRELLRQYDTFVNGGWEYALRADQRYQVSARAALDFLDVLSRARTFLAPVIDNERRQPEYLLVVGEGDVERTERWTYGEPVRLLATSPDSTGMMPEVTVTGGWAALKAARRGGVEPVRLFHPDTRAELTMPVFPVSAPDIRR